MLFPNRSSGVLLVRKLLISKSCLRWLTKSFDS